MTPFSLRLYRLATRLAEPIAAPLLRRRMRKGKEDPSRLAERLGYSSAPRPEGPLIWMHAASVGESLSLLPLVRGMVRKRPDVAVLVTSGTLTSASLLRDRLPTGAQHQFAPVDAPVAVNRFLQHWRPNVGVFVESEIWPNLILSAKARSVRLALLSARLSDESLRNWRWAPAAGRALLEAFDVVMPQDDASARKLAELGARPQEALNLKRLAPALPADPAVLRALKGSLGDRPLILAASTHAGEDDFLLAAFSRLRRTMADLFLIIAPRHPDRCAEIAGKARTAGFSVGVRSHGDHPGVSEIYIADTLGELGLWFTLARAAYVGGSLLPGPGGHNPVEPAQLNCPIIAGPYLDNWRSLYDELTRVDGVLIAKDAESLALAFEGLLKAPDRAREQAIRARQATAPTAESLEKALERLEGLLP